MSVKVNGLADLAKRLEGRTDKIRKAVDNELTEAANAIEERAKLLAPVDRGLLRGQIVSETTVPLHKVVYSQSQYAAYLEFGTKSNFRPNGRAEIAKQYQGKGRGGSYDDLIDNLTEWVRRKGLAATQLRQTRAGRLVRASRLSQSIAQRQLARFIAKIISIRGIKPANNGTGYFYRSYDELLPAILKNIETILK